MYCGKCGKPNEDGATVCANCGAELKPATFIPPAPPSAAEPAEGNTPPAQNPDANAAPAQNPDANAVPPQNTAPNGAPPQNFGPNGVPPQNFGPNGAPPQNFGPNGAPPQNFGPNGAPPQNFGPNGMPPQNFGPNGAPPQNFGPNGMPPQNFGAYAAPAQGPKKPNPVIEKMKPVLEKAKTLPKAVFIGAGAGLVALIVLICVLAAGSRTINLDKYLTIETSGYNGYGEATATIDWARMEKECSKKISFSQKAKNNALVRTFSTPFYVFRECVGVKLDKYKDLSNGDEINYTWSISSEMELYLNCKVKYTTDGKKKVSDLTEVETFDAFADLQIEFTGSAPAGRAELKYSGDMLSSYDFSMDKSSGLSNGDVITVTLDDYVQSNCLSKYGKVPAEKSKEYTVSGLSEYVGAFKDLPEDFITKVKSEAEDTISAYCANDYSESSSMTGLTYAG